jgi:hypothetical protein
MSSGEPNIAWSDAALASSTGFEGGDDRLTSQISWFGAGRLVGLGIFGDGRTELLPRTV